MVWDCLVPSHRFGWFFEELVYMRNLIFCLLALFCVLGCSSPIVANEDEVGELLKKGAVLVDVRTQDEFDSGHLEKAVHLPYQRIEELPKLVDVEKDTESRNLIEGKAIGPWQEAEDMEKHQVRSTHVAVFFLCH